MTVRLKVLCLTCALCLCFGTFSIANHQFEQIFQFVTTVTNHDTSLAFWIEDTSGNYKYTVYVSRDVAKFLLDAQRPSILPVWAHRRVDEWGTGYPTAENPLPDAVTSATPETGTFIWNWAVPTSLEPGDYFYFVEVNNGRDYNDYHKLNPEGQPSVVYKGSLKVDAESTDTTGELIGHGHEIGDWKNSPLNLDCGGIATTMDSLTTALSRITSLYVNHLCAPSITTASLPNAHQDSIFVATVSIQDFNSQDSHTFQLLEKPYWMIITNTGLITGTPTYEDVGDDIRVVIRVEDADSLADTLTTTIDVINVLDPPLQVTVGDVPNDNGHRCRLTWDKSPDDGSGLFDWYYIYRSRSEILTEPVPLTQFDSIDTLMVWEQYYTILIDSVQAGITEYIDDTIPITGEPYYYWLQSVGVSGESEKAASGSITAVNTMPHEFRVCHPYPNPFNPSTTIRYEIPESGRVKLVIYDITGKEAAVLTDSFVPAGIHETVWDGRNSRGETVGSGIYVFHISAGGQTLHGKMLLLR